MKESLTKHISLLVILLSFNLQSQSIFTRNALLMGSDFEITIVDKNESNANFLLDLAINEISRIEKLISSWDKNSQTSLINLNAGIKPVKVDKELFDLITRALKISDLSQGAFDISYASLDKIWYFDKEMLEMPSKEDIIKSVSKVGYYNIILNKEKQTVFLKIKGMKIGFGAIGKGYAADMAKSILVKNEVKSGIINASGDLTAWGKKPSGKDWMVAIVNPLNKSKIFSWLPIKNKAVVTSGNYERFIKFNDKSYSHIIDPRTGYPSQGILSVTIFTEKAELADALATSVFVLGQEIGMNLINQLKGIDCIIINKENKILKSKNIEIEKI
ncbi:FAD:protein FMN transferase [Flavobacteriaceae bacterium]|nr:FAD:protein FMN transferase [Flavobacteriaceae bacterium]